MVAKWMVSILFRSYLPFHPKIPTSSIPFQILVHVESYVRSDALLEHETCASSLEDRSFLLFYEYQLASWNACDALLLHLRREDDVLAKGIFDPSARVGSCETRYLDLRSIERDTRNKTEIQASLFQSYETSRLATRHVLFQRASIQNYDRSPTIEM